MVHKKFGILLNGGGNRVFFNLGFLQELRKHGIRPSLFVGVSASSAVMFEEIFGGNGESLKYFGDRLNKNKKNFYWINRPHFPHNGIYETSIKEIFEKYWNTSKSKVAWKIVAAKTKPNFVVLKCFISSFLLLLRGTALSNYILKSLGIKNVIFSSKDYFSKEEIINIIVGSSTIYPFICPHFYKKSLILDGGLFNVDSKSIFKGFDKVIVLRPVKGVSEVRDKKLYIFPSKKIPFNVLDYTNGDKLSEMYAFGKEEAQSQLAAIKKYLQID